MTYFPLRGIVDVFLDSISHGEVLIVTRKRQGFWHLVTCSSCKMNRYITC